MTSKVLRESEGFQGGRTPESRLFDKYEQGALVVFEGLPNKVLPPMDTGIG